MIERIVIENFKSFRRAELKLGRLNVLIGTNASGKSNFFDALRVLQGIGYGLTIGEILDGKPKSAKSEVWEQIRGGSREVTYKPQNDQEEMDAIRFSVEVPKFNKILRTHSLTTYSIAFSASNLLMLEENLCHGGKSIISSHPGGESEKVDETLEDSNWVVRIHDLDSQQDHDEMFNRRRTVLSQLRPQVGPSGDKDKDAMFSMTSIIAWALGLELSNMQHIDLKTSILRGYSQRQFIERMGEFGENFAALVEEICSNSETKQAYRSWLQELRPEEINDVEILPGAANDVLFALREGNRTVNAKVLSDGTLRFAAIVAAFFQPEMPSMLMIEEIENGFHPSRMRLLVELLRSRAGQTGTQVFVTTHSPTLLAWLDPEDYATTFLFKRDEQTGESQVRALTEIPEFNEVVLQKKQPIGELLAQGWLEAAL